MKAKPSGCLLGPGIAAPLKSQGWKRGQSKGFKKTLGLSLGFATYLVGDLSKSLTLCPLTFLICKMEMILTSQGCCGNEIEGSSPHDYHCVQIPTPTQSSPNIFNKKKLSTSMVQGIMTSQNTLLTSKPLHLLRCLELNPNLLLPMEQHPQLLFLPLQTWATPTSTKPASFPRTQAHLLPMLASSSPGSTPPVLSAGSRVP